MKKFRLSIYLALAAATSVLAASPTWWTERGVVATNAAATNDFAAINQGQLKWIASNACQELEDYLPPPGAGTNVWALIAFLGGSNDYRPVNAGQLKYLVAPFYVRLIDAGYTNAFPWTTNTLADDRDFALANIGQVKYLFDFDLRPDSDEDEMADWWEMHWFGDLGQPSGDDPDEDGLSNLGEFHHGSCPTNSDTDADGLSDGVEVNTYGTDPILVDTDGDGLSDYAEIVTYGTDPLVEDSDGDGVSDGAEIVVGTDPNDPDSHISVHFVSLAGQSIAPYTNWVQAATNIQDAIDAAATGSVVLVADGTYAAGNRVVMGQLRHRVALDKPLLVRSVNGPAVTIIDAFRSGSETQWNFRCAYVTNGAILAGMTLKRGNTLGSSAALVDHAGGGAWCEYDGVISNCIVTDNSAFKGGGICGGLVLDSIISDNTYNDAGGGYSYGAGVYSGRVDNCVIENNSTYRGGGAAFSAIQNSLIKSNGWDVIDNYGGGTYECDVRDSMIASNSAGEFGGGCYGGLIENCVIVGNEAGAGGGADGGTNRDCLIIANYASSYGGGVSYGVLQNCTVVKNDSVNGPGGLYGCQALNSVIYTNTGKPGENPDHKSSDLNYCCTPAPDAGAGNITNTPCFVDIAGGDFRLADASPCLDAGTNMAWMIPNTNGPLDLFDGHIRVVNDRVDIGADEHASGKPEAFVATMLVNTALVTAINLTTNHTWGYEWSSNGVGQGIFELTGTNLLLTNLPDRLTNSVVIGWLTNETLVPRCVVAWTQRYEVMSTLLQAHMPWASPVGATGTVCGAWEGVLDKPEGGVDRFYLGIAPDRALAWELRGGLLVRKWTGEELLAGPDSFATAEDITEEIPTGASSNRFEVVATNSADFKMSGEPLYLSRWHPAFRFECSATALPVNGTLVPLTAISDTELFTGCEPVFTGEVSTNPDGSQEESKVVYEDEDHTVQFNYPGSETIHIRGAEVTEEPVTLYLTAGAPLASTCISGGCFNVNITDVAPGTYYVTCHGNIVIPWQTIQIECAPTTTVGNLQVWVGAGTGGVVLVDAPTFTGTTNISWNGGYFDSSLITWINAKWISGAVASTSTPWDLYYTLPPSWDGPAAIEVGTSNNLYQLYFGGQVFTACVVSLSCTGGVGEAEFAPTGGLEQTFTTNIMVEVNISGVSNSWPEANFLLRADVYYGPDDSCVYTTNFSVVKVDVVETCLFSYVEALTNMHFTLTADSTTNTIWTIVPDLGTNGARFATNAMTPGITNIWRGQEAWLASGFSGATYVVHADSAILSSCGDVATGVVYKPEFLECDWCEAWNKNNHHTSAYQTNALVLRRSDKFRVNLTLNQYYEHTRHAIWFQNRHDFDGPYFTNDVPLVLSSGSATSWYCQVVSVTVNADLTRTVCMEINIPSTNCPIGEYDWRALVSSKTNSAIVYDATNFPGNVIILFNPWSANDSVYMVDTNKLTEYILADRGGIQKGFRWNKVPISWKYSQFTTISLLVLLNELNGQSSFARSEPILLSRYLSKHSHSVYGGILVGRWGANADYSDGTHPNDWNDSADIFSNYLQAGTTTSVKYGQCWVYAGILTSRLRCAGIPARPITTYDAFHDKNANKVWDVWEIPNGTNGWKRFYDASHPYEDIAGVWYHVWCDAWMKRPDRTISENGWQAVDGTYMEPSSHDGYYQIGPAPLNAVKNNYGGFYDVDFVWSEVSASQTIWRLSGTNWISYKTTPNLVGHDISTKEVNKRTWEDITSQYK